MGSDVFRRRGCCARDPSDADDAGDLEECGVRKVAIPVEPEAAVEGEAGTTPGGG